MKPTNRRKFITTSAALALGTAASAIPVNTMANKYPVIHHVLFWLKNPSSKEDKAKLIAGLKTLGKIPVVREIRVGVLASTEKRDVVDTSWSVSELMFFSDLAGQAAYQDHPIHKKFVETCSPLWEKVVVYDAIDV